MPFKTTKRAISKYSSRDSSQTDITMAAALRIYRKTVSNLKIREAFLRQESSDYEIGPTIIWTEDASDLSIFTADENYTNYIGFESPFNNPRSAKYLTKIIQKMRMTRGTILIKEATPKNAMHIPVHFCAYRVDETGIFTIFDPSWHSKDPGIYSTSAFYESLDAFGIVYTHAECERAHHWQSLLLNDVFCQTWTLQWLKEWRKEWPKEWPEKDERPLPLPKTRLEAAKQITQYIQLNATILLQNIDSYMEHFPKYKLEGHDPKTVFNKILSKRCFRL